MTKRWIGTGHSARGAPGVRQEFRLRPLTLVVVALAALAQTGCQSGFFGPCGASPCGANPCGRGPCSYLKGLRERVFNRGVSSGCCGSSVGVGVGVEAPLEYGTPAVVTPGPALAPVLPAAPAEIPPTDLAPAPIEKTPSAAPEQSSGLSPSGLRSSGKATYVLPRPRSRLGYNDGENIARTMVSTPEPASRSAKGSAASESWLDNLPPLSIPKEDDRNELPAPASERAPAPPLPEEPVAAVTPAPTTEVRPEIPTPDATEVSVAPGIKRFVALEPKLSGGSLPTTAGLDWLVEKGYKTLLDLRETSDVQPDFIDEVASRGLRYVALPLGLKKVDAVHVARFNLEISESDARPLYFCDTDGTRAGTLWYIRRMTVDKVDAQVAKREAGELGLADKSFWGAATAYLETLKPAEAPVPKSTEAAPQASNDTPMVREPELAPNLETMVQPSEVLTDVSQIPYETLNNVDPRDTTAWRSYAALVVTGLGVPLAYWGRTALPSLRILSRASLPGPARRPKSLPTGSGD